MSDITVRIGAETGGVEAGAARAGGAVEAFGSTVQRTRTAARAFAQEVRRVFQAPSSNVGAEADKAAAGLDRAKNSAKGAARESRDLQRDLRGVAPAAAQAGVQLNRTASSAERLDRSARGARGAIGALGTAFALLGVRQVTQEFQDAAFAQFGFESALSSTTGGMRQARSELAFIEETAGDLGLVLQDSVAGFVALSGATKGTVLQGQATRDIWEGLVIGGVALNRSNEQLKRGQEAINQIASKGVVSMEEIRQQLAEAIPGSTQIAARAMNMTAGEFVKLVSAGKIMSDDFLPKFAAQMKREFGPTLEAAMNTPLGRARRELAEFANATFRAKQAAGRGFLSEMTVGLRALNQELSSPEGLKAAEKLGETLGEAFTAGAKGVIFLADNMDRIIMAAQMLAGGALIRWLVVSAAEAKAAAIAYSVKGAAARSAAATATAGATSEAAANLSLRAGLQAVAVAEVQRAEAALVAAKATYAAANATATEARQTLAATGAGVAYTEAKVVLTRANGALIAAEAGVAAAAARVTAAQTAAALSTTAMASAMAAARGAAGALLAMVGGPWGAAFLAAGAAVWMLTAGLRKQAEVEAEVRDRVNEKFEALEAARKAATQARVETGNLTAAEMSAATQAAALTGEQDKLADAYWRVAAAAKAAAMAQNAKDLLQAEADVLRSGVAIGGAARRYGMAQALGPAGAPLQRRYAEGLGEAVDTNNRAQTVRDGLAARRAELRAMRLEAFASGEEGGGGGGAGAGSGGSGPDRVSLWQNELDRMLVAEGNFFGESASAEVAFWEGKRALTTAGTDDRLQIDRKLFSLRRSMAQDELRAELEDLQTKQQLAQGDYAEQMRLQDLILARLAETYGEDSREYQRALQDKVRLQQAAADEQVRIEQGRLEAQARAEQATADADEAAQRALIENQIANADLLADLGLINAQERGAQRRALAAELRDIEVQSANEQFRIQKALLESQLALENLRPEERRRITAELAAIEIDHAQRMRTINAEQAKAAADDVRDAMREAAQAWRDAAGIVGQGAGDILNNAVTGARSFGEVWEGIGTSALNAITSATARMIERWITTQFALTAAEGAGESARAGIKAASVAGDVAITGAKTGVHLTAEGVKTAATGVGVAARTGIEATGAATSIGLSASVALADVANSAVRAAAGAYAAIAGIPVIGPVLAPVTAAAALAAVLALGKSVFSARGGAERVANDGDMYELHRDEMVLPASIATPLRSAIPRMTVGPVGQAFGGLAAGAEARKAGEARSDDMMQALGMLASAGGGGDQYNISAVDARSVKRLFDQHGDDLRRAGERQSRDLKVNRP